MVLMCDYKVYVIFIKQKTAYEMRISEWSSDVCSSDLLYRHLAQRGFYEFVDHPQPLGCRPIIGRPWKTRFRTLRILKGAPRFGEDNAEVLGKLAGVDAARYGQLHAQGIVAEAPKIGRASCRERVCQYVSISVVAVSLKKQNTREELID